MLLTEEQARKKFCPILDGRNCIASGCMMWRWHRGQCEVWLTKQIAELEGDTLIGDDVVGYCGLAGSTFKYS